MKNIAITSLILALATGCASQAVQKASVSIEQSSLAYGAVIKTKPLDMPVMKSTCPTAPVDVWGEVCRNLSNYEHAHVAFVHSSRLVAGWVVVPTSWKLQPNAIVQVNPKRAALAERLVAQEPRSDCRWTGHSLESLTGTGGIVKGLAAGLLIIPAVAVALDDTITEGGVECDGWSYKSLIGQR